MTTEIALAKTSDELAIEAALCSGDLSNLTSEQRISHFIKVCETLGLNPMTKPFDYLKLNGKLILYANRTCTDQLRTNRNISLKVTKRERAEDLCVVSVQASTPDGRIDEATGAVALKGLSGDALANALMKCETKAKRRATLSICGLGWMDETEVETVSGAKRVKFEEAVKATTPAVYEEKEVEKVEEDINANWDKNSESWRVSTKACTFYGKMLIEVGHDKIAEYMEKYQERFNSEDQFRMMDFLETAARRRAGMPSVISEVANGLSVPK